MPTKHRKIKKTRRRNKYKMKKLDDLPDELIVKITNKMNNIHDLEKFAKTNKTNRIIANERILKIKNILNKKVPDFKGKIDVFNDYVREGEIENVRLILKYYPRYVNNEENPLMLATMEENIDMVRLLLKSGADPNKKTDGEHSLIYANYEITELLLKNGANPNIKWLGNTSLMEYSDEDSIDMVRLFLKYGADPNIKNNDGKTALIQASKYDRIGDVIKLLLKNGAKPNLKDNEGNTALMIAKKNKNENGIEILKKY
tara:strand:- start:30 stop:803 length:774 start_codon:yes stop_codon:yes gene_type:complete